MGTDVHSVFQKRTENGWQDVESQYDERRHYALFAWIGNVRNGHGFAGIQTHTRIEPLSDRRGFPADFETIDEDDHPITANAIRGRRAEWYKDEDSNVADDSHLRMWMGDHSHSWLSGTEILAATPPRVLRTGVISIEQFRAWDGESSPASWSGGIGGPGVVMAESPSDVTGETTHVRIEWFDETRGSFAYFIDEVQRLTNEHGEVRFVFGFDS
jgi:hypothetical protein